MRHCQALSLTQMKLATRISTGLHTSMGDNFPNPCINLMHTPPLIETTPSPISLAHRYCAMQQEADCLGRP